MKLFMNLKPTIIRGTNVNIVKSKAQNNFGVTCYTMGDNCSCYATRTDCIVYNIVKKNAKRIRTKNNKYKKVNDAEVVAYVYNIPKTLLKNLNIKVTQKSRNFKIQNL